MNFILASRSKTKTKFERLSCFRKQSSTNDILAHYIMFLFTSEMRSFSYVIRERSKTCEEKDVTRVSRLPLKVEPHFRTAKSVSANQVVLDEDVIEDTPRKESLRRWNDKSSARKL